MDPLKLDKLEFTLQGHTNCTFVVGGSYVKKIFVVPSNVMGNDVEKLA